MTDPTTPPEARPEPDDGTSPGVQCGAVHDIAGRCTRDMAHPGAHVARSSKLGHGSGGWLNERPSEPATTYVEVRRSDENLLGVIGGALAKHGFVPFDRKGGMRDD